MIFVGAGKQKAATPEISLIQGGWRGLVLTMR